MRVLFVNPIGGLGGAEQSLLDALAALKSAPDLELSLLLLDDGPLRTRAEELGIPVEVLALPESLATIGEYGLSTASGLAKAVLGGPDAMGFMPRLSQVLSASHADVVHTNGIKAHWLVCALRRGPTVLHFRDFISERRMTRRALLPLCAAGQRVAISISEAVDQELTQAFPGLPTQIVYDGIDTDGLRPGPSDPGLLSRLAGMDSAPAGTLNVGILGTYARWKGQDAFLRAAAEVLRAVPDRAIRFFVIGGPIYRTQSAQFTEPELAALAGELGIGRAVGFIPFQSEVLSLYRSLDVIVHASTQPEPFGRTIVEAMACGRSVVAMREGGARELFVDGIHALGADPRSIESLAVAVKRLVTQPELRAALGRRGREHTVSRFSRARLASEMRQVYARATGGDA